MMATGQPLVSIIVLTSKVLGSTVKAVSAQWVHPRGSLLCVGADFLKKAGWQKSAYNWTQGL